MARMQQQELSPVYVNNDRVRLQGEAKPAVRHIVDAAGHDPNRTRVMRLKNQNDAEGKTITLEEFIDRTEQPSNPVWLKCLETERERQKSGVTAYGSPRTPGQGTTSGFGETAATGGPPTAPSTGPEPPEPSPEPTPERRP